MRLLLVLVACAGVALATQAAPVVDSNEAVKEQVLALQAEAELADADDDQPLSDEMLEMLYRLEKEGKLAPEQHDDESSDELELDLEPPANSDDNSAYYGSAAEDAPMSDDEIFAALEDARMQDDSSEEELPVAPKTTAPPAVSAADERAKKAKVLQKKGEAEFESFVDPVYTAHARANEPNVAVKRMSELHFSDQELAFTKGNLIFIGIVGVCATVALVGSVIAGVAFYKLRSANAAAERDNMYGVTAAAAERMAKARAATTARGDQSNAYSAQLQHYQQTKNEIIRIEQAGEGGVAAGAGGRARGADSDESDAENEEPDYSVYECPGLAPTGDIEVSNPIFDQQSKQ